MDPEGDLDALQDNAILARLPAPELQRILPHLRLHDGQIRESAYESDRPIVEVLFPLTSVYSMIALADGAEETGVEVGTIGREGMVGLPLFLGAATSPHHVFCQIPGRSAVLPAKHFQQALVGDGSLHRLLNRYVQATMVQIAQNTVCNNVHLTEQRAARWLVMTADRCGRNEFALTQDFLAQMLGVSRTTVSEIASGLQQRGLIKYSRGAVTIADRAGLEQVLCSCYGILRREFDQMVAAPE
jgi:CRP-like cAMP-binding protein